MLLAYLNPDLEDGRGVLAPFCLPLLYFSPITCAFFIINMHFMRLLIKVQESSPEAFKIAETPESFRGCCPLDPTRDPLKGPRTPRHDGLRANARSTSISEAAWMTGALQVQK